LGRQKLPFARAGHTRRMRDVDGPGPRSSKGRVYQTHFKAVLKH